MKKGTLIAVAAAFALGGLVGALSWLAIGHAQRTRPWRRAARPGPRWRGRSCSTSGARAKRSGAGRPTAAPRCISIIRAKIGFCNCTTGVADDEELERL